MIFKTFCVWISVLVLTNGSTNSSDSSMDSTKETIQNYEAADETFMMTTARDGSSARSTEMSLRPKEPLHSLNEEDIIKIREIENYYKRFSTDDLLDQPDPDVILKHRIFLTNVLNHVMTTTGLDSRLSSTLKELLSTIDTINGHSSLKSSTHSTATLETNTNQSIIGLLSHDTSKIVTTSDITPINSNGLPVRYNTKMPILSDDNLPQLEGTDHETNSKDPSSSERIMSNSTLSKRYGELLSLPSLNQPYSSPRRPSSLPNVYQTPQGVKHKKGAMNHGSSRLFSHSVRIAENITESPLAIADTAALEEDMSKKLLELLIQAHSQGGTALNYNNILESALADLTQTPSPTTNKNVPVFATSTGTVSFGNGPGLAEGVSPEVLASLLVKLQLPTADELTKLQNQLSNLVKLVGQDTRLQTVDPATLEDILTNISNAIISIITGITTLCSTNPLICILTAVAICALVFHLYKHKYGKKKYKDSGYGHDSGGYHRKNFYDYDTYRMLDVDTQTEVTSDILGKIDVFDDWIKSVKDFQ